MWRDLQWKANEEAFIAVCDDFTWMWIGRGLYDIAAISMAWHLRSNSTQEVGHLFLVQNAIHSKDAALRLGLFHKAEELKCKSPSPPLPPPLIFSSSPAEPAEAAIYIFLPTA